MPSEVRRDQWGRYLVVPPSGSKPKSYTRATTVAKALDDGGGLMPWKAAMAMTGMMRRPGLRGRFEALMSAHPETGPWYGGDEAKTAVKKLVEECAEAGGSSDRADIGTALHAIVEQINRGGTPVISQDSTRADVDAYQTAMSQHGIVFHPGHIEATVVLDAYQVAGTADGGAVHVPQLGTVIADLKTGTNLDYSWQAIAVQLAIYANGDNHYRQGDATDGSADLRLPAPDVRKDIAVVIHLPAGEARCVLYTVDIAAGWEAFERSMWARKWRGRKDLASPLTAPTLTTAPVAAASPAGEPAHVSDGMRLMLLEQVHALPADRQQVLKDSWPANMPPLKLAGAHWTTERLVEVSTIIMRVAANGGVSSSVAPGTSDNASLPGSPSDVALAREATGTGSLIGSAIPVPGDHTPPSGPSADTALDPGALSPAGPPDGPSSDAGPAGEYLTAEAFGRLDRSEQARLIDTGHLPPGLRTPPERLLAMAGELTLLPTDLAFWVAAQGPEARLPPLGHPARWTKTRGERLRQLLEAAQELWRDRIAHVMNVVGDENQLRELIVTVTDGKCEQASQLTAEQADQVIAAAQGISFPCDWAELTKAAGLTKAAVQRQAKALGEELGVKVPSVIERLPADGPFALRLAQWITTQHEKETSAA